jgi:tape measure domain-containing protein
MAVIREELQVVDKFTAEMTRFTQLGERMAKKAEDIEKRLGEMGLAGTKAGDQITKVTQRGEQAMTSFIGTVKRAVIALGGLHAIRSMLDLSDTLTLIDGRLRLITGSADEAAKAQEMIFAAAQRSRGEYIDMLNMVTKLRIQTGQVFGSLRETTAFVELLEKQFKIAGTDAMGIKSTMYNLTQALAEGVLRGQDLRYIFSNAPQLVQRIADYMGLPIGKIREIAETGSISADIVKNAILSAGNDINAQFDSLPMTFGQAMTKLKNEAIRAFSPIRKVIADSVGSETFTRTMRGISKAIAVAAFAMAGAFGVAGGIANVAIAIWDRAGSIIMTVGGYFLAFKAIVLAVNGAVALYNGAVAIGATIQAMYAFATGAATAAQVGFNVALATTIIIILAVVTAVGLVAFGFHVMAGTGHTALGDLCGALNVARMFVVNLGLTVWMIVQKIGAFFAVCARNIKTAFGNAISGVKGWLYQLMSSALTVIGNIARALNELPFVEFDYSGIVNSANEYAGKAAAEYSKKQEYEDVNAATYDVGGHLDDIWGNDWAGKAFDAGAFVGDDIQNSITSGFKSITGGFDNFVGDDFGDLLNSQYDLPEALNNGKQNVGTVDKVKKIEDVKLSDEDLKIYRDLAERRYLNQIELQTLAPNISVTIPEGQAHNLSAQDIADKIKVILIEQAAAHTSVSHA